MLSDREIRVIRYLYNNKNNYCTSTEIGSNIGFSEKTIRESINSISQKISKDAFEIISKRGSGFKIYIHNHDMYLDYMYKSKNSLECCEQIYDKESRENYILKTLLLENKRITFDNLINIFFISESTLQRYIYDLKSKLKDYDLEIYKDKKNVLSIVGKELDKRHFILDFFFSKNYSNSFIKILEELNLFDRYTISQLLIILLDEIRNYKISVNDYIIQNLVIHFALVIERVKKNLIIDNNHSSYPKEPKIYKFTKSVIKRISNSFDIKLPCEEKKYIYLQLLSKTKIGNVEPSKSISNNEEVFDLIIYLSDKLEINLFDDIVFLNGFIEHLRSLKKRVNSRLYVSNPFTDEIKYKHKYYFDLIIESFNKFSIFENKSLPDDEWSYLVIYILSALERNKSNKKINILIVCASGFSTGLMLKSRIQNEYNNTINIKGVVGYYEITREKLENIDFIVSSVDLKGIVVPVPYVNVSVFLDKEDCKLIDKFIENIRGNNNLNTNKDCKDSMQENIKIFNKYFSLKNFYINNEKKNKDQVLDLIFKKISGNLNIEQVLKEETLLRERFGKVVFKNIIAIPHPVRPLKSKGEIFSYISKKDIYWDESETKVKLIFYISPPSDPDLEFEKIISIFTKLIKDKLLIEKIININNFTEFRRIILNLL